MIDDSNCLDLLRVSRNKLTWIPPNIINKHNRLLNIGCEDGQEAVLLQWTFMPEELLVIDKKANSRDKLIDTLNRIQSPNSKCWNNDWKIRFKKWDILKSIPWKVGHRKFDLIYCENVLYYLFDEYGEEGLYKAIRSFYSLLEVNAYLLLDEFNVGLKEAESKKGKVHDNNNDYLRQALSNFVPKIGEPIDISPILQKVGFGIDWFDQNNMRYVARKSF